MSLCQGGGNMSVLRKPVKLAVFCVFILIMSLFTTCDDTVNPFSSNLGPKVVVEPPTVNVDFPVSGAFLSDIVTFTGTAKAYVQVKKVEVYIFENVEYDKDGKKIIIQKEIDWTEKGIVLSGGLKNKTWTYKFDSRLYNSHRDGLIRMKFRVYDTKTFEDSIELI